MNKIIDVSVSSIYFLFRLEILPDVVFFFWIQVAAVSTKEEACRLEYGKHICIAEYSLYSTDLCLPPLLG